MTLCLIGCGKATEQASSVAVAPVPSSVEERISSSEETTESSTLEESEESTREESAETIVEIARPDHWDQMCGLWVGEEDESATIEFIEEDGKYRFITHIPGSSFYESKDTYIENILINEKTLTGGYLLSVLEDGTRNCYDFNMSEAQDTFDCYDYTMRKKGEN